MITLNNLLEVSDDKYEQVTLTLQYQYESLVKAVACDGVAVVCISLQLNY